MEVSLRQTSLAALKKMIAHNAALGNIPKQHQRLLYLGKELKDAGHSLQKLGVGNFGVTVVHVHNTHPKSAAAAAPAASSSLESSNQRRRRAKTQRDPPPPVPPPAAAQQPQQHPTRDVIDLADSDSDDDEVCVVDVVASAASASPRTKRQRVA